MADNEETLLGKVFGAADSDWNAQREIMEVQLFNSAEALMQHTGASAVEYSRNGITVKLECYDQH